MKVTTKKEIQLSVSPEEAWRIIQDIPFLAECIPGAQVNETVDQNNFKGQIRVKAGPVTATFHGTLKLTEIDASRKTLRIEGAGRDDSGQSHSALALVAQVQESDDSASVIYGDAQIDVTGRLASMGGRMLPAVADSIISDFSRNLKERIESHKATEGDAQVAERTPAPDQPGTFNIFSFLWRSLLRSLRIKKD